MAKNAEQSEAIYMVPEKYQRQWVCPPVKKLSSADCYAIFLNLDLDRVGNFSVADGDMSQEDFTSVLKNTGMNKKQRDRFFELLTEEKYTRYRPGQVSEDVIDFEEFKEIIQECYTIKLSLFERIYLTFEAPGSSFSAYVISTLMLALIIVSSIAFIVESLPDIRTTDPDCGDGSVVSCEPQIEIHAETTLVVVEFICVIGFSVDYFLRLLVVPFVRPCSLGFGDDDFVEAQFKFDVDFDGARKAKAIKISRDNSKLFRLTKFLIDPMNVIDFVAIAPFYVELALQSGSADGLMVLRVLRLGRVFRVLKLGKRNQGLTIFVKAFAAAGNILLLLFFVILLICVLFGTLVYLTEQGTWHDPHELCMDPVDMVSYVPCGTFYPRGAYLRVDASGRLEEESPFASIVSAAWMTMVTISTVGYGDMYPTTPIGKFCTSIAMILGLLILALPITVIGGAFAREVRIFQTKKQRAIHRQKGDYKEFLVKQRMKTEKGSKDHRRISRKLKLYEMHENETPDLPSVNTVEEGSPDFIALATAHKVEHHQYETRYYQEDNHQRLEYLEQSLLLIAKKIGAEIPSKPKKGLASKFRNAAHALHQEEIHRSVWSKDGLLSQPPSVTDLLGGKHLQKGSILEQEELNLSNMEPELTSVMKPGETDKKILI